MPSRLHYKLLTRRPPNGFLEVGCVAEVCLHNFWVRIEALSKETIGGAVALQRACFPPPFSEDGLLSETNMDCEEIAVATLDLNALLRARETGDVRNWHDRDASVWGE